jgi:Transposase, Mutator family
MLANARMSSQNRQRRRTSIRQSDTRLSALHGSPDCCRLESSVWIKYRLHLRGCGTRETVGFTPLGVAYGVRRDGTRQLLAFLRSPGESQSAWEGLLGDLYRRGLRGDNLLLIVTDCSAGLAAVIPTVYSRVLHQRCWVHKMRNILEKVRRCDYEEVKSNARPSMGRTTNAKPRQPFAPFAAAGKAGMAPWSGNWSAICRNCSRSSTFLGICGRNCAPPISSSVVSWRCEDGRGPWSAL